MKGVSTLHLVQREVARILNVEHVDPDTGVGELGIDSLNQLKVDQFTTLRELDGQLLEMGVERTGLEQALPAA